MNGIMAAIIELREMRRFRIFPATLHLSGWTRRTLQWRHIGRYGLLFFLPRKIAVTSYY